MNKASNTGFGSKDVFSRNLQRYVSMSGDNQKVIAAAIGVSAGTFCDWMKGRAYPRMDKVQLLANYFGIKKSDLVEDAGEMELSESQEQQLLMLFNKIPNDKKENFLKMVQLIIETQL